MKTSEFVKRVKEDKSKMKTPTKEVLEGRISKNNNTIFNGKNWIEYTDELEKAIGVLKLIEKWGLADLSLDELDRWRDRGRWHVDYVARERWKEEPLEVFVLMKEHIENKEVVLDGVFSSMERLNAHIQSSDENGDNLDSIIHRLEVIQTNVEDVMNWTIEEIQERSWHLRSSLEDIIIDLEEHKKRESNECNIRSK